MSLTNPSPASTIIPTVTGNPALDGLIRSILTAASMFAAGWLVVQFKITDPNLSLLIGGAVFSVLLAVVMAAWSYIKNSQIGQAVADAHLVGAQSVLAGVQAGATVQATLGTVSSPVAGPVPLSDIAPADLTHADVKALIAALPPSITPTPTVTLTKGTTP